MNRVILFAAILLTALSGCYQGVPQSEYDLVVSERDLLRSLLEEEMNREEPSSSEEEEYREIIDVVAQRLEDRFHEPFEISHDIIAKEMTVVRQIDGVPVQEFAEKIYPPDSAEYWDMLKDLYIRVCNDAADTLYEWGYEDTQVTVKLRVDVYDVLTIQNGEIIEDQIVYMSE